MKLLPLGAIPSLVLLLAACPSPDRAHEATADLPETTEPGAATITPTPEVVRTGLAPMRDGTTSGELSLRALGARTSVQLSVRDAPANSIHQAHIHQGSCADQGPVAVPLEPVITDAAGLGTSVTTIDLPLATVTDGRHYAQVHSPGEQPGPPIACGEIGPAAS